MTQSSLVAASRERAAFWTVRPKCGAQDDRRAASGKNGLIATYLEASNPLILLEPYFGNMGKRLIKTPKIYFPDTGLLCFLLGLDSPAAMEQSPFIGALWETFILNQILKAKSASASAASVFFGRDAQGPAVDFVVEHQGHLRLIETKWTETFTDTSRGQFSMLPHLGLPWRGWIL